MKVETKFVIYLIFVVGVVMRIMLLFQPNDMWHDASFTYLFSQEPVSYILDSNDVHPPLYTLFMKLMISMSSNEFFIRATTLITYIAFFFVLYKFLKKNCSSLTTLITLVLISLSPTMILYSIEPRNYMLGMVFVIAQVFFFKTYLETGDTKQGYFYVLFSILMLYTHYFTVFVLVVEGLYLLYKHRLKLMTIFLEAFILIGFLSIPLIIYFLRTLPKVHSMWFKDITLISFISTLSYQLFPPDTLSSAHAIFFILFICLWIASFRLKHHPIFHYMMFFIPVVIVWAISQIHPLYHHRFFLFYSWAFYILIAQVIEIYIQNKKWNWIAYIFGGVLVTLLFISFLGLPATLPTELNEAQQQLKNVLDKDSKYAFIHQSPFSQTPMKYYFRDWKTFHFLNTTLTKKQRFTAGGSVIKDWEILNSNDKVYCYDGCIFVEAKANQIFDADDIIYYDNGGLIVYGRKRT